MICKSGQHDKCYEMGIALLTDPIQKRWVCRICLEKGVDTFGHRGIRDDEYNNLINKSNEQENHHPRMADTHPDRRVELRSD